MLHMSYCLLTFPVYRFNAGNLECLVSKFFEIFEEVLGQKNSVDTGYSVSNENLKKTNFHRQTTYTNSVFTTWHIKLNFR